MLASHQRSTRTVVLASDQLAAHWEDTLLDSVISGSCLVLELVKWCHWYSKLCTNAGFKQRGGVTGWSVSLRRGSQPSPVKDVQLWGILLKMECPSGSVKPQRRELLAGEKPEWQVALLLMSREGRGFGLVLLVLCVWWELNCMRNE